MKKGCLIAAGSVIGLVLIAGVALLALVGSPFTAYNTLVEKQEAVTTAWSQVENVYQRRADLVPNLVATVKGYAAHEADVLTRVTEARARVAGMGAAPGTVDNPEKFAAFQQAQGELSSALSRLMVVVENYPQLRANEGFLNLQSQLEGTENRITVERMRYNETAQDYNTYRRKFPMNIIAGFFDFQAKEYFQMQEGADIAPQVDFTTPVAR
jgi:LemA protein